MVKTGSVWTTSDRKMFTVTDVITNDNGTMIHYRLQGTDKQFNCLIDAFLSRFTFQET